MSHHLDLNSLTCQQTSFTRPQRVWNGHSPLLLQNAVGIPRGYYIILRSKTFKISYPFLHQVMKINPL